MTKRTVLLLLVMALAASAFSCGGSAPAGGDTTAADTTAAETSLFNIPKEDNGGRKFTMLIPTHTEYEYPEEATGEVVNDALYARSQKV